MADINWDKPFYVDPNTGETTDPANPDAIAIPTFGQYWGGNYSAGLFGGVAPTNGGQPLTLAQLLATPSTADDPAGPLDYLAYRHDVAWQSMGGYTLAGAQADLAFLNAVVQLDARHDPEESLIAGITTFGMIGSITLHGFGNLLLANPLKLILSLNDAVHDIQYGLENLPSDELTLALSLIFEPAGANEFVFDFAITTRTFAQEFAERVIMKTLNGLLDGGEADNVPLNTGFLPGTTHYELSYNAISGDLDLVTA